MLRYGESVESESSLAVCANSKQGNSRISGRFGKYIFLIWHYVVGQDID